MADPVTGFANTAPAVQADVASEARARASTIWPLVSISALLFLPSAIRYLLGTSSNTLGLVAICLMLWVAALATGGFVKGGFGRRAMGFALPIVLALVGHLGIAVFLPRIAQPVDAARTAASVVAFIVAAITAGIAADWLLRASSQQIDRIAGMIRVALVLIGLWCFAGGQPPSPLDLARPSFPFTEPSHYALVAAPFIIDGCVRTTLVRRIAWLAVWLGIGLINQSLSLLVAVAIAAIVSLPIAYALVAMVPIAAVVLSMDLQYYTDRLDFSADSTNLSSLVYRQGWELMQQGLAYSKGWGIGFQQLGFTPLNVPTSDLIYRILGDDSNLRDGSFLAAKLVSELGVIGIMMVAAFFFLLGRTAFQLRAIRKIPGPLQPSQLRFAAATVCAFATEMFVRGLGYFSSTAVLFVAAFIVMRTLRRREPMARA